MLLISFGTLQISEGSDTKFVSSKILWIDELSNYKQVLLNYGIG